MSYKMKKKAVNAAIYAIESKNKNYHNKNTFKKRFVNACLMVMKQWKNGIELNYNHLFEDI